MSQTQWSAVDSYLNDLLVPHDPALEAALRASADAGLPPISVSPSQGKLLHLLAKLQGARKILEIGTLGGYSAIWLARALPEDGRLVTLEAVAKHAKVAQANVVNAGLQQIVKIRLGPALDTLPKLAEEGEGPFDLTFIDADKERTVEYFRWAIELSHPGSVVIVDNVIRNGRRQGHPPLPRAARQRAPGGGHRDPDRRQQGLGRVRPGAGQLRESRKGAALPCLNRHPRQCAPE